MNKAILILLTWPLFSFTSSQPTDTIEKEFKTSLGKRLTMELKTGGTIDILGWDKEVVRIKVKGEGRDAEDVRVAFDETSSGVEISSFFGGRHNNRKTSITFTVNVPRRYDLDLESMGGGINIENVEGEIEGKTMGGPLNLTKLKGTVSLTTMGGAIKLTDSDVDGRLKTMGGKVLVENVVGDVIATSQGGNVTHRNVKSRSGETKGTEVNITTMGGDINVEDAPRGADVHTMGGDIHIKSAMQFTKAKTMGGDIEIDAVDGWVQATTMGGDVTVKMTGDPAQGDRNVNITSMGGDITLTVPSGLSMEFDISLAYTRNSRNMYRITSDFPIEQEETPDWEYQNGSPRKYIYGTGTVAGGRNKIKIQTVNGNVTVRKGR